MSFTKVETADAGEGRGFDLMKKDSNMTQAEFQRKYHDFSTQDQAEAEAEAEKVNEMVGRSFTVVAVELPPFGWCLILKMAADELREMRVLPPETTTD